ncbi:mechanosensitive ion channel family protein [Mesonia sp. K7]|uniref:mechanosensitive ion channel family protein n=1 Tax=Mesonia sp. K7 TaxID=2218606 RepID=UPI000DAA8672|nr:mechanosensitive ion channel family protein [Mesonia sp. K7]PZD79639.1 mechanosensitive ion channel family protein [Mesonia sp. K7]
MILLLQQKPNVVDEFIDSTANYLERIIATLPRIALGLMIIILGVLFAQIITNFYRKKFLKKTTDPLMASFLSQAVKTILIVIAAMLALEAAGLSKIATGVLTAAGGAAIILGFAFQDIGKNFLAGIILAFNRPFHINDTIKVEEIFGKVKALKFRYTHIKTSDGRDIYIPNSDVLTKPVSNYTADGYYRVDFIVGIGYEDDIQKAKDVITSVLESHPEIVKDTIHENFVVEDELAASTVNLKVFFWVETKDYRRSSMVLRGEVIKKVKNVLAEHDFNLPADVKEIKLYKGETGLFNPPKKDQQN